MEEKIKAILNAHRPFIKDKNFTVDEVFKMLFYNLSTLFEQEKQAYTKEMCRKAFNAGQDNVIGEYNGNPDESFNDFIKENFPEK